MDPTDRGRLLLACIAVVGGLVVVLIATELFPYGSVNHDEGVYLQQAELLLDGRLWFETPLTGAFRWWFFVEDGSRLYSKYQPVVPVMFATGLAVGTPRLVLGVIGAGVVGGIALLTREAYGTPTAMVAGVLVILSPLYLFTTSVFLPYAPASFLNLVFAYAYVRRLRTEIDSWGILAGLAVGLAFFARPYTAVLFALPFIGHAFWLLWRARAASDQLIGRLRLLAPIAGLGTAFVGVTLAYNAVVTGDLLVFPYQAFAPMDGPGFGRRVILGYERVYTPALALEANARVLWEFATRSVAAPPLGAVTALLGVGLVVLQLSTDRQPHEADTPPSELSDRLPPVTLRLLFIAVLVSVILGNIAFWGNLNVLGDLSDPTDGFISAFGPFYHYDLLLPLSAFGASGIVWLASRGSDLVDERVDHRTAVAIALVVVLAMTPAVIAMEANALDSPVREHTQYTDRYDRVYEPFADSAPEGVVFVPTPYGEWLGHPFQSLRNDGELEGATVYALDRRPAEDFAIMDAYPNRDHYRFRYRGEWTPEPRGRIVSHLQPIDIRSGARHRVSFATGVVGRPSTVRIADGDDSVTYTVTADPNETLTIDWTVTPGRVFVVPDGLSQRGPGTVTFDGTAEIAVAVTYVQSGGATVTYRQEVAVEERGDTVRIVWPPENEVCRLTPDCSYESYYLPGGEYLDGVSLNQTVR